MEQRLTCANHSDEDVVLDQIGWNNFNCPICGRDYSIGRKVVVLDPRHIERRGRVLSDPLKGEKYLLTF